MASVVEERKERSQETRHYPECVGQRCATDFVAIASSVRSSSTFQAVFASFLPAFEGEAIQEAFSSVPTFPS